MQRLVIEPTQQQDDEIHLTSEQKHYLCRVLRLGSGDRFIAMNGMGMSWLAELRETSALILQPLIVETELSLAVTLVVALPKGNGFDDVVRCCTELGVSNIIPVISDRTLLKPSANKLARWRKIASEAAEQSERQLVPTILEPDKFDQVIITLGNAETNRYICVTRQDAPHLWHCLPGEEPKTIVIATGPEGGWTEQEVQKAIASGFQPVSLGNRILRAVTAPIMVASLAAAIADQ